MENIKQENISAKARLKELYTKQQDITWQANFFFRTKSLATEKLKELETVWINNSFKITDKEIEKIVKN